MTIWSQIQTVLYKWEWLVAISNSTQRHRHTLRAVSSHLLVRCHDVTRADVTLPVLQILPTSCVFSDSPRQFAVLRGGWTPTWYTGAPGAALVTHCNSSHSCSHTLWAAPHPDGRDWMCSATPSSAWEPWQVIHTVLSFINYPRLQQNQLCELSCIFKKWFVLFSSLLPFIYLSIFFFFLSWKCNEFQDCLSTLPVP